MTTLPTPAVLALAAFAVLGAGSLVCCVVGTAIVALQLRGIRSDNGTVETAIADLHLEMRGRLMLQEAMLSRQPVGDGDTALITAGVEDEAIERTNEQQNWRFN